MIEKPPILFLVFNRHYTASRVFEMIRNEKPNKLYIAADGPRDNFEEDFKKCEKVREIFSNIDWECKIFTLFQKTNLGPMKSQITAINWFFENESEGIILEDDSLPNKSFFRFCETLLKRYRNDKRISMISGCNYQKNIKRGKADYYFSKYTNTCGWATWRDSWARIEISLNDFSDFLDMKVLEDFTNSRGVQRRFKEIFINIKLNPKSRGWDFRFMYSSLKNGCMSIVPNVNLIKNIGFGPEATNTFDIMSPEANLETFELDFPIKHPNLVTRNLVADEFEGINNHYKRSLIEKTIFYSISWKKLYYAIKTKYLNK